ncbi:MAG: cobalt ECF transporter T component CbiQ [Synergistaceae bacterium]|jgi:cobalt/nickel transport system permease protein|nr:cobalt ECF transporter T component CbiQ [Synergistaceae bacterium]
MPPSSDGFSRAVAHINALEVSSGGSTFVHRLHPLAKMTATAVYVVVVISFGRYEIGPLMPFFFYPAILTPLSETPCGTIFRRLLPAVPFALFGGMGNVYFDRTAMAAIGGFAVTGGAISFASIMIKTLLSVWAILLLASTTGMPDLSRQLASLGVPDVIVLQFIMTYRYLSVLVGETGRMYRAYILRSAGARGVRMRDMGTFVGTLLLRSIDRAERVYAAMKCRGFSGSYRAGGRKKFSAADLIFLFAVIGPAIFFRCWR